MDNIFDWEEEWEWEKWTEPQPIIGQLSFFPADKSSFLKSEDDKNNIFSDFWDIIFKNPAYTIEELQILQYQSLEMDDA